MPNGGSRRWFWVVAGGVVVLDVVTKLLAVSTLSRFPLPVVGDWVTLQLVYNPGAAFGIHVGDHSRWVFTALAVIALVVLGAMVRQTRPTQHVRLIALGLVCGGAIGNLIDRLRSARGVVDFIDVGVGAYRWPTFNVADIAVTCGAVVLAFILWGEGRDAEAREAERGRAGNADPANASSAP